MGKNQNTADVKNLVFRLLFWICIVLSFTSLLAIILLITYTNKFQDELYNFETELLKYESGQPEYEQIDNEIKQYSSKIRWLELGTNLAINIGTSCLLYAIIDFSIVRKIEGNEKDELQLKSMFRGGFTNTVSLGLDEFWNSEEGKKKNLHIRIICYGTGGFRNTITTLHAKNNVDKIEIVVCSPTLADAVGQQIDASFNTQKSLLEAKIAEFKKLSKVTVYASKVLPTVRSIRIRCKCGSPLFCAYQPYYMSEKYNDDPPTNLMTADIDDHNQNPFTIVLGSEDRTLKDLAHFLDDEFNRLAGILSDNGSK